MRSQYPPATRSLTVGSVSTNRYVRIGSEVPTVLLPYGIAACVIYSIDANNYVFQGISTDGTFKFGSVSYGTVTIYQSTSGSANDFTGTFTVTDPYTGKYVRIGADPIIGTEGAGVALYQPSEGTTRAWILTTNYDGTTGNRMELRLRKSNTVTEMTAIRGYYNPSILDARIVDINPGGTQVNIETEDMLLLDGSGGEVYVDGHMQIGNNLHVDGNLTVNGSYPGGIAGYTIAEQGAVALAANVTLTASAQVVTPTATPYVPIAGRVMIYATWDFVVDTGGAFQCIGRCVVDSNTLTPIARFGAPTTGLWGTITQVYELGLSSGSHSMWLQGLKSGAVGAARCTADNTRLCYQVLCPAY